MSPKLRPSSVFILEGREFYPNSHVDHVRLGELSPAVCQEAGQIPNVKQRDDWCVGLPCLQKSTPIQSSSNGPNGSSHNSME